jgi:hypothetical protein
MRAEMLRGLDAFQAQVLIVICSSRPSCLTAFAGKPSTSETAGIFVPVVTSALAPMIERAPI